MKTMVNVLLMSMLLLLTVAEIGVGAERSSPDGKWRLVWSDEFNDEGMPDKSIWRYEKGFLRNRELQLYTESRAENARVEDGHLIIEARKEEIPNPRYDPDAKKGSTRSWRTAQYTSASLTTRGTKSIRYGRVEVRAKLPTGRGTWPAIWMLAEDIGEVGWPLCGEIDIMENVGYNPDQVVFTVHTKAYNHVAKTQKGRGVELKDPWKKFHVYAIEWHKDRIDFFLDGEKVFTFANEGGARAVWPFNRPFYLLINLAIGGGWGGVKGVDDSLFPHKYYIDYVRVYQQKR